MTLKSVRLTTWLLLPLGMAIGALLMNHIGHHSRAPCTVVHTAVHPLAHPTVTDASSQPSCPTCPVCKVCPQYQPRPTCPEVTCPACPTFKCTPPQNTPSSGEGETTRQWDHREASTQSQPKEEVKTESPPLLDTNIGSPSARLLPGLTLNNAAKDMFFNFQAPAPLMITFGSIAMSDFILNWVAHVKRLNLKNSQLVVAALDSALLDLCQAEGLPAVTLASQDGLMTHRDYFRADEKKFVRMGEMKLDLVRPILLAGYHIIVSDADVVFMSDPWPFLLPGLAGSDASLSYRVWSMVRADVLSTTDCIDEEEDTDKRHWLMNKEFNTGVLFFRGTQGSLAVIDRWKDRILVEKDQGLYINDQAVFNRAFHGPLSTPLAQYPDFGPPSKSLTFDHWDSVNMRKVFQMRNVPGVPPNTTIGVLPMVEFLNGHSFFVARLHEKYSVKAVALHATYQFGDSPQYSFGKRERLRRAGLWLVDQRDHFTPPGGLLVIKGTLDQGFRASNASAKEGEEAYDGGVTIHLQNDALQRRRLMDAFALAITLNRTLVLPTFSCFCDRYWWLLHKCRMPGAERMDVPFECPFDHIFEPGRFYQTNLPFRVPGFLEDPQRLEIAAELKEPQTRALLPSVCFCSPSHEDADCEARQWRRLSGVEDPIQPWEKHIATAKVVEVKVEDLTSFCLPMEELTIARFRSAFSMKTGFCAKERNKIPPNWKPELMPLNCSWGYELPESHTEEFIRKRKLALSGYKFMHS